MMMYKKTYELGIIYAYLCKPHTPSSLITLLKLHVKFQPDPLKIFVAKVEKVKKMHKLY